MKKDIIEATKLEKDIMEAMNEASIAFSEFDISQRETNHLLFEASMKLNKAEVMLLGLYARTTDNSLGDYKENIKLTYARFNEIQEIITDISPILDKCRILAYKATTAVDDFPDMINKHLEAERDELEDIEENGL